MEKMADTDPGLILDTVNTQFRRKTALLTNNSNSPSNPRYSRRALKYPYLNTLPNIQF